jgi:hypothetical protein
MFDDHVVDAFDEMARQLVFVGLLGNDRLPRRRELVDDARERENERLTKQSCFRAEMPEEEVFGDACALGDLSVVVLR